MGKVDEFVIEQLKNLEEKEGQEKEAIEDYKSIAEEFKEKLDFYKEMKLQNFPFLPSEDPPRWYEFFDKYLKRIISNPKDVRFEDDFILKQLKALKCSFSKIFWVRLGKLALPVLFWIPLFFLVDYYLVANNHPVIFVLWNFILFVPLLVVKWKYLRGAAGLALFLSILFFLRNKIPVEDVNWIFDFWINMSFLEKLLFLEVYFLLYLVEKAWELAKSDCIESVFSFAYSWAEKLVR